VAETPNIAGFSDAQARLRDKFGLDVKLLTPVAAAYASGSVLDPSTGRPYDPRIRPTASGFGSVTIRATVIADRVGTEDDTQSNAAGIFSNKSVVLDVSVDDWPKASAATQFEVIGQRYEIRDAQPDGFAQITTRHLIFGERL
jgi:hypothetical protein